MPTLRGSFLGFLGTVIYSTKERHDQLSYPLLINRPYLDYIPSGILRKAVYVLGVFKFCFVLLYSPG